MQGANSLLAEMHGGIFAPGLGRSGDTAVQRDMLLSGGSPASWKLTTAMNASLLLLLLLRLNRVLVPWILKLLRRRRSSWVSRVPIDVARELRKRPNTRLLCAGPCCLPSYGCFDDDDDDNSSSNSERSGEVDNDFDVESRSGSSGSVSENESDADAELDERSAERLMTGVDDGKKGELEREPMLPESVQRWVNIVRDEARRVLGCSPQSATAAAAAAAAAAGSLEVDEYFKLRVAQEERHRARSRRLPLVAAPRDIWRVFTFISLLVYWAILMVSLLATFKFETFEACSLGFSLLSSGVVSEWDVLFPLANAAPPAWLRNAADNRADSTPLINVPTLV